MPSAITVATRGRRPRLREEQGKEAINEFLALGIRLVGDDEPVRTAYPLAHRYGCAFYDGLYLALAERLRLPFLTADQKLFDRVGRLPYIRWIADGR
ncbi:MAG: type II toxin-antitoxin system VapC family toxin [Armatimonadota bacterium]